MLRIVSVALSTLLLFTGTHAATRALEPQDLFKMQWANDPQISKDGSQIVYVRTANDIMTDGQRESLWILDTATGAHTPLASGPEHYTSPRWSPDGSKVAYLSTGADGRTQIMVRWLRSGQTATLTRLVEQPSDITWSPDGKQIAFTMLEPVPGPAIGKPLEKPAGAQWGEGPIVIDQLHFRADGHGPIKPGFRHVYTVSLDGGGTPRQLTSGPFSDAGPLAWSPDGRWIYFASNHDPQWQRNPQDWARHTSMILSIYRVSTTDGRVEQLSHEVGPYNSPAVSPDGKLVAYLGYPDKHIGNQNVLLYVMNADGSNPRVVSEALDRSITQYYWAADGRSFYISYVDRGVTKVARIKLDGRMELIASGLARIGGTSQLPYSGGEFSVSDQGTVAYTGGGVDHLPEVYLAKGRSTQRLTNLNSELLSEAVPGKLEALPVKSTVDGRAIDAWMVFPPNFDPSKKYPLILEIHGGPYASYGPTFSADYQFYASAGYIVLYGNPRGSTSYGEEFANTIHNNYPSKDYDDLMSMVDAAIERGFVDADNLFVTGSSGGGVLTAWIVGKTQRFKAAVTQRPVINWTSWLLTADMGPYGARYWFKQLPWEDQETYWKHSPLAGVGNVTTPTMVLVALSDLRTPVPEAEQFYQALQLRNVPTLLYGIPGASHGKLRPSQFAQASSAIIEWFERYRGGRSK
jgi:dipeptidyl aminopeptidase/acylaminoacyl peptidase